MDKADFTRYGIDYDKGLKSCMGKPEFFKKILQMFLEDRCFCYAKAAYDAGDQSALFSRLHEFKGISGSAGLMDLYQKVVPFVELLRPGNAPEEEIKRRFPEMEEAYLLACEGIREYLEEE